MFRDTGFCHVLQKSFDGIEHPQTMLGVFTGEQEEPSGFLCRAQIQGIKIAKKRAAVNKHDRGQHRIMPCIVLSEALSREPLDRHDSAQKK